MCVMMYGKFESSETTQNILLTDKW